MKKKGGIFLLQLSRLLTRKEFKLSLILIVGVITAAFVEMCSTYWGEDQSRLYASSFGWLGNISAYSGNVMQAFYFFGICFISALPFSDSFLEDKNSHSLAVILGRTTWKTYWQTGLILSFAGGFFVIFVPFLVSQLLSFLIFPSVGGLFMDNREIGSWFFPPVRNTYVFPYLTLNHIYLSNLLFMFSSSLFAGCNAAISYLLSQFGVHKKLLTLGIPTLFWITYNFIIVFINSKLVFQIYLYPNSSIYKAPWFFFVLPLSLILIILAGCLIVQRRKKEAVLL